MSDGGTAEPEKRARREHERRSLSSRTRRALSRAVRSGPARRFLPWRLRYVVMSFADLPAIRALDPDQNRKSRPPDNEDILVEAVWVVECYPPSYLGGLIKGLESLGVGRRIAEDQSAADHVRLYRSGAYAGGTVNLGFFTRRGGAVFGGDYVETDLPRSVSLARGWLENLTPSLTAVVVQFELTEEARRFLKAVLDAEYRTEIGDRTRHGWSYRNPENRRRQEMDAAIAELTRSCAGWLDRHFPGAFASGLLGGAHPSGVFLTTKATVPFVRPEHFERWLWLTRFSEEHDAWESEDWPGLRLRVPDRDRERYQWWLAGRRGDFLSDPDDKYQEFHGGPSRAGWLSRIEHEMSMLLTLHGTDCLLLGMHDRVSRSRDTMGATASRKWNVRRLERLRSDATAFVRDVAPIATDLASRRWRVFDRAAFKPAPGNILSLIRENELEKAKEKAESADAVAENVRNVEPLPSLAKYYVETIRDRAQRLQKAERQHSEALATISNLVAAVGSYRLNRRLFVVTLVLGAITIVAQLPSIGQVIRIVLGLFGTELELLP
jgi:hypothetical protein